MLEGPARKWIALAAIAALAGLAWGTIDPGRVRLAVLLLLAAFAHAAFAKTPPATNNPPATTSVTVDQLDKLLAFYRQLSDGKAAQEIAGVRLSERASAARVARCFSCCSAMNARSD